MAAEISQWVDPDGTITLLDVDWKASGRFMPGVVHEADGTPGQPGLRVRASRHAEHDFTIRITLTAASEAALRALQRATVYAMDPVRTTGKLRVTSPIGDVREINCRYVEGLGMEEEPGPSGPTMQQATITFRAFDPYWYDTTSTTTTFTIGAVPTFFPIFPIRLTSSAIAVDSSVINTGDVLMWPEWTITGPGGVITLRNLTTGQYIVFSTLVLGGGETALINTDAGTAVKGDGTNVFPDLDILSDLWALQPGINAIRLEMSGATAGVSKLSLSYKQRYLAP
jgi:hypothetical protein